jgi:hypothetical protein
MVNIPPEYEPAIIARAKALNRPVANYIEWLVRRDIDATYPELPGDTDLKAAEPSQRELSPPDQLTQFASHLLSQPAKKRQSTTRAPRK